MQGSLHKHHNILHRNYTAHTDSLPDVLLPDDDLPENVCVNELPVVLPDRDRDDGDAHARDVRGHDHDDDVHARGGRDHDPRSHSRSGHRRDDGDDVHARGVRDHDPRSHIHNAHHRGDGVLHVHVPHAHVPHDGRGRNRSHRNPWTPWNSFLSSLPYEISLKFI